MTGELPVCAVCSGVIRDPGPGDVPVQAHGVPRRWVHEGVCYTA